jgi:hypothetical protein
MELAREDIVIITRHGSAAAVLKTSKKSCTKPASSSAG